MKIWLLFITSPKRQMNLEKFSAASLSQQASREQ
jgi:hypothetical protein